jgi:hypothetical protein
LQIPVSRESCARQEGLLPLLGHETTRLFMLQPLTGQASTAAAAFIISVLAKPPREQALVVVAATSSCDSRSSGDSCAMANDKTAAVPKAE